MERHQPENLIVKSGGSGSGADGGGDADGRVESARGTGEGRRGGGGGGGTGGKVVVSRAEVVSNLVELFKEVGVRGGVLRLGLELGYPRVKWCSGFR